MMLHIYSANVHTLLQCIAQLQQLLPRKEAVQTQCLACLICVWCRGVVHRDLKLENLLLVDHEGTDADTALIIPLSCLVQRCCAPRFEAGEPAAGHSQRHPQGQDCGFWVGQEGCRVCHGHHLWNSPVCSARSHPGQNPEQRIVVVTIMITIDSQCVAPEVIQVRILNKL